MSAPYTHAEHAKFCRDAGKTGRVPAGLHVQVRLYRSISCARIVDAWDTSDGVEMWQLDLLGPIKGRMSLSTKNVRQCQGIDGRCTCASESTQGQPGATPELATRERQAGPEGVTC